MTIVRILYKVIKWSVGFVLTTTGCAGLGLYWYQCKLVYPAKFPESSRTDVITPYEAYKIPYTELTLTTPDSVRLRAYQILAKTPEERRRISKVEGKVWPNGGKLDEEWQAASTDGDENGGGEKEAGEAESYAAGRPTVIMYHANAGNMGHRLPLARKFWFDLGCNVVMLSYRGYGKSEGSPSEKGLRVDAQTMLDYVTNDPILGRTKIILYGQSIGSSVTLATASSNPHTLSGLIIENSPFSISSLVDLIMPYLSPFVRIPYMLTEKWDAGISVPLIKKELPMLMLAGEKDELVLPVQMEKIRRLRERTGGKVKFVGFEDGTHNDTYMQPGYWQAIEDFLLDEIIKYKR